MSEAAPPPFPRTARALRDAMEAAGLAPRRHRGQCFLTDVLAVDAIVRDALVAPGDAVVEIGTGTGLLTHALEVAGAEIDTFDIDPAVSAFARSLRAWPPRVRFHLGDALAGKHALAPALVAALHAARARAPGRTKVVSNLPYNVATPLVLRLLALPAPPDDVVVLLQREVAEKFLAAPGDPDYGPPSILCALLSTGRILRRFPPDVFWPAPRVQSALLHLRPRPDRRLAAEREPAFATFLLGLFSRRRKVLASALRAARPALDAAAAARALAAVGLSPTARPEDAAPEALLALLGAVEAGD